MKQTCTLEDLIRFLYHETTTKESFSIARKLAEDFMFNEQFVELVEAKSEIPSVQFLPSKNALNTILNYSKSAFEEAIV